MRSSSLLALAIAGFTAAAPASLLAQDPMPPAAEDSAVVGDDSTVADTDEVFRLRPGRGGDDNPYLREVHDHGSLARRHGPWASLGLGAGGEAIANLGAPGPYGPARFRPTLSLAIGDNVGQHLRLGLDGFVWFNLPGGQVLETVAALMFTGRVYPAVGSGFYLRAGGGVGRYGQDLSDNCDCGSTALVEDWGFAWTVGAGYEVPVHRGLWLGPSVEVLRMDVDGPDGYRERVVNFGLTLTYDGRN